MAEHFDEGRGKRRAESATDGKVTTPSDGRSAARFARSFEALPDGFKPWLLASEMTLREARATRLEKDPFLTAAADLHQVKAAVMAGEAWIYFGCLDAFGRAFGTLIDAVANLRESLTTLAARETELPEDAPSIANLDLVQTLPSDLAGLVSDRSSPDAEETDEWRFRARVVAAQRFQRHAELQDSSFAYIRSTLWADLRRRFRIEDPPSSISDTLAAHTEAISLIVQRSRYFVSASTTQDDCRLETWDKIAAAFCIVVGQPKNYVLGDALRKRVTSGRLADFPIRRSGPSGSKVWTTLRELRLWWADQTTNDRTEAAQFLAEQAVFPPDDEVHFDERMTVKKSRAGKRRHRKTTEQSGKERPDDPSAQDS